jgi:hypothetical protein
MKATKPAPVPSRPAASNTVADGYLRTSFILPRSLAKEVKIAAAVEDRSISALTCDALRAYLQGARPREGGRK